MKKIFPILFIISVILVIPDSSSCQSILNRIKNKAKQRADNKVDNAIDKSLDEAEGKSKPKVKPDEGEGKEKTKTEGDTKSESESDANSGTKLSYTSKFDFVPGEKIIAYDDFSGTNLGDFPANWNTNSSGEVVTAKGQTGHWLMIRKTGRFIPEYITSLPENFTLQFDLVCNEKFSYYSNPLQLFFLTGSNNKKAFEYSFIQMEKRSGVKIGVHPTNTASNGGTAYVQTFEDGETVINNQVNTTQFNSLAGKTKVKVSVWRQKQRIRVYLNEEKVFDLPRAFAAGKAYGTVLFEIWSGMNDDADRYLVNNINLAVGAPDTRNKLITEGKFVTHGILFDVNSDKIKPESYGVIKEIASVLEENEAVKIKIVGHTDSDGDDGQNMELSKKRAESVKNALTNDFQISASRIQTDGKGESMPVGKNDTSEGKAQNRRVEFIKM